MDTLRGAMILLVIFFHATARVERYDDGALGWLTEINLLFEPFRMPALVFISGLLLPRSVSKPWRTYASGKVRTLLWPYLVWSVAFIGLLYATGAGQSEAPLTAQLLGIASGTATYLWFLSFLFLFYMISFFLPPRVRTIGIFVSLALAVAFLFLPDGYQFLKFFFLLAFFWLGDWCARAEALESKAIRHPAVLIIASGLAMASGILAAYGLEVRYSPLFVLGAVGGVLVLASGARAIQETWVGRALASVGINTVVYYTSHYLIIAVTYFVMNRLFGVDQPWVLFVALVVSALAGGWILTVARDRLPAANVLFVWPSRNKVKSSS